VRKLRVYGAENCGSTVREVFGFELSVLLSPPHTRATCWANRLARQLAQLCIFTAHVWKTTPQQHNWQNHLHFPPFCSKSHEETMVSHWLIDSNSSAHSSQHPQTLRFSSRPREVKSSRKLSEYVAISHRYNLKKYHS
jgi:hypothetical protein